MSMDFNRRQLLACTAAAMLPCPTQARGQRGLLLRGAEQLLPMNGPPVAGADILLRDGRIAAIGANLFADDVDMLDLSGHIVLPGLVDTHWHMWNTAARGYSRSDKGGFAPTMATIAPRYTPQDAAIGVELALAEAVNAGITTVHNWAHNTRSPAHAEAEIQAMAASGVRGRYAYGYAQELAPDRAMNLDHLAAIAGRSPSDLVGLGLCARGPDRSDRTVWQTEWATARRLGLPVSTHMASDRKAAALGGIRALADADGLGPQIQLVHLTAASRADMDIVAQARSPVSLSPWTELEVGYGIPPVQDMVAAGLTIGLSVDNMVLAGSADMFAVIRLATDLTRGVARDQLSIADERALRWATIDGTRSLGLADRIGTLEVGKRADIIAVSLSAINMTPASDPYALLTHAARPENVSFVLIDGVIHKQGGRLARVDVKRLQARARQSIDRIRAGG